MEGGTPFDVVGGQRNTSSRVASLCASNGSVCDGSTAGGSPADFQVTFNSESHRAVVTKADDTEMERAREEGTTREQTQKASGFSRWLETQLSDYPAFNFFFGKNSADTDAPEAVMEECGKKWVERQDDAAFAAASNEAEPRTGTSTPQPVAQSVFSTALQTGDDVRFQDGRSGNPMEEAALVKDGEAEMGRLGRDHTGMEPKEEPDVRKLPKSRQEPELGAKTEQNCLAKTRGNAEEEQTVDRSTGEAYEREMQDANCGEFARASDRENGRRRKESYNAGEQEKLHCEVTVAREASDPQASTVVARLAVCPTTQFGPTAGVTVSIADAAGQRSSSGSAPDEAVVEAAVSVPISAAGASIDATACVEASRGEARESLPEAVIASEARRVTLASVPFRLLKLAFVWSLWMFKTLLRLPFFMFGLVRRGMADT